MTDQNLVRIAEVSLVCSLLAAAGMLFLVLTVFFGATRKIEDQIATRGKQLDGIKRVWGNGPIGRWMRSLHIYAFFLFRRLPRYGRTIESRMGDEDLPVPQNLKLLLIIPMTLYFVFMLIVILSGSYLKYVG